MAKRKVLVAHYRRALVVPAVRKSVAFLDQQSVKDLGKPEEKRLLVHLIDGLEAVLEGLASTFLHLGQVGAITRQPARDGQLAVRDARAILQSHGLIRRAVAFQQPVGKTCSRVRLDAFRVVRQRKHSA